MPSPNNNNNNPNSLHNDFISLNHPKGKPIGVTSDNNHEWNSRMPKLPPTCLWAPGTVMDLSVLITDSPDIPNGWPSLTTTTTTTTTHNDVVDDTTEHSSLTTSGNILASWQQDGLILGGILPNDDGTSKKANNQPSILSGYLSSNADQTMNHRNATLTIPITPAIWNNETQLYAFVRLQRRRTFRDGTDSRDIDPNRLVRKEDMLIKRMTLTRYRKRKKNRDVKSLLDTPSSVDTSVSAEDMDTSVLTVASRNKTHDQILLYMKPFVTLQLIDIASISLPHKKNIPSQIANHMDWYEGGEGDDQDARSFHVPNQDLYYPILYQSEFWMTSGSLKELNGTVKESKLDINVETVPVSPCMLRHELTIQLQFSHLPQSQILIKMWKWQLQSQTEDNWRKQEAFTGEEDEGNDMLRNMLLETNPYLLVITAIVSVLHTVFDILAFKNDISFFKNKKSMEGLSLRSMIVNAGFSFIIFLYLADNDTSFMVLMSNGVGLAIDVWKISKAITLKFEGGKIEWVEVQSYKKSKTKEYDEIATSHLLFVTMPLVAGYGMYSLFYQKHRGWYSWILNTLVGFIYMFGFVMMTPQLFINYKLQSVAHLNWRTMTYKSINTFIDDLFAFVIKMPIMHRLACLRDDLIFFIYLFQRYKYKTDFTRVNEFGQCAQPTEEMLAEQARELTADRNETSELADADFGTKKCGHEAVSVRAGESEQRETAQSGDLTIGKRRGARDKKE